MTPSRLIIAGLSLVLLAVVLLWVVGKGAESGPFTAIYYHEWLVFLQFFVLSVGGAGVFLVLRGIWLATVKNSSTRPLPRIFPALRLRNLTVWKGRSASPSLVTSSLNAFSVSWVCVLTTIVTIFMIFGPWPSKGLRIDLGQRTHISAVGSPWPETMSVYIGHDDQFYVNGKAIERQELEIKLQAELGRRAVWIVYLEADDYSTFEETVFAIDTIQGLGANVVWITPRTRAKWSEERGSPGFPRH